MNLFFDSFLTFFSVTKTALQTWHYFPGALAVVDTPPTTQHTTHTHNMSTQKESGETPAEESAPHHTNEQEKKRKRDEPSSQTTSPPKKVAKTVSSTSAPTPVPTSAPTPTSTDPPSVPTPILPNQQQTIFIAASYRSDQGDGFLSLDRGDVFVEVPLPQTMTHAGNEYLYGEKVVEEKEKFYRTGMIGFFPKSKLWKSCQVDLEDMPTTAEVIFHF